MQFLPSWFAVESLLRAKSSIYFLLNRCACDKGCCTDAHSSFPPAFHSASQFFLARRQEKFLFSRAPQSNIRARSFAQKINQEYFDFYNVIAIAFLFKGWQFYCARVLRANSHTMMGAKYSVGSAIWCGQHNSLPHAGAIKLRAVR